MSSMSSSLSSIDMSFIKPSLSPSLNNAFFPALKAGRLSHAVVFEGGDADTRIALAKYTAAALVCPGENPPCGECGSCIKAAAGSHPDIIEVSAGDGAKTFSVDRIREIRSMAYIFPNESEKKVFILRGADTMTEQAQNALLKILEEPPSFVTFILECRSKSVLLPTVLSRSDVYSLGDEKLGAGGEKLEKAREAAIRLALALCEGSEWAVMKETGVFEKDKELYKLCLTELVMILRAALVNKFIGNDENAAVCELSAKLTQTRLLGLIDAVNACLLSTDANINHNLSISRLASTTATERIY